MVTEISARLLLAGLLTWLAYAAVVSATLVAGLRVRLTKSGHKP